MIYQHLYQLYELLYEDLPYQFFFFWKLVLFKNSVIDLKCIFDSEIPNEARQSKALSWSVLE